MFQLHQEYLLVCRNIHGIIRTKNFNPHKDFYNHWNSPGLNYKSWGTNLGKLMNCLLSALYAFWETKSTNQGDYCYLLVYCGSFWTLKLRSGHHCVRHSAPLEQEPGSAWKRFGAEQTRQAKGGKGRAKLREETCHSLGGSCPGVCLGPPASPEPCLQDHPPEMRKRPGFLCYIYIAAVDTLFLLLP